MSGITTVADPDVIVVLPYTDGDPTVPPTLLIGRYGDTLGVEPDGTEYAFGLDEDGVPAGFGPEALEYG